MHMGQGHPKPGSVGEARCADLMQMTLPTTQVEFEGLDLVYIDHKSFREYKGLAVKSNA